MIIARQVKPAPRALVADPDPDVRALYEQALGLPDFDIDYAYDGREALVKVLEQPVALLITEIELPLIDGYALCELVRKDALIRTMPIVVVTTDGRQTAQRRAMQAGADAVFIKPWANGDLAAEARRLIRGESGRTPVNDAAPAPVLVPEEETGAGRPRGIKSRSHKRYDTSEPPVSPPILRCPSCDRSLTYGFSHIGGVSAREPEQWDYYTCSGPCGQFQYRQRTRKLQRV
jgi:two-component system chemotaxis response regulator CheY